MWYSRYFNTPAIFIAHVTLNYATLRDAIKSLSKAASYYSFALTHKTQFVSVGELKKKSWPVVGKLIFLTPPAALPAPGPGKGYDRVLVVGNGIRERGAEVGYDLISQVMQKIPLTIIGNNPHIEGAIVPKQRSEFIEAFRSGRIYLYATRAPYNDGYNVAMIEAMSMGMAIVTIKHPSSPIVHKHNGLVGETAEELVSHIQTLMKNPSLTDELGLRARETVDRQFSETAFIAEWNKIMQAAAHMR